MSKRKSLYNNAWAKTKRVAQAAAEEAAELARQHWVDVTASAVADSTELAGGGSLDSAGELSAAKDMAYATNADSPTASEKDSMNSNSTSDSDVGQGLWDPDDYIDEMPPDEQENCADVPQMQEPFSKLIAKWAVDFRVSHQALDALLIILRGAENDAVKSLPLSARTLLRTRRKVVVEKLDDAECVFYNAQDSIINHFKMYPAETQAESQEIPIALNVDGLPLFNSSKKS